MTIKITNDLTQIDYPRYDNYKDSGVDWLGEVPEGWELLPLKALGKLRSETGYQNEDLLSVYLYQGVIKFDDVDEKRTNATSSNLEKYQLVDIGDFVLNNQQAWRGSVGVSKYRGIVSPAYIILSLSNRLNSDFANYMFRDIYMVSQYLVSSRGVGTIQRNLYWNIFKNSISVLPPLEEQEKIAKFLESRTTQIDQAITLKQQQIAKLEEYKQIIIQNAVTKGLNPDAPMKDSGVDWIGNIPEHWEVKKLKYISNVVLGKMICNEDLGGMYLKPYLKSKNIQWLNVDITSVDKMWFTKREMQVYRLKKDDLILSEGGEVGKTCIWDNELNECYIQNSAHKVSFNSGYLPKYFLFQFFTLGKQGQFNKIVNRVSIGHLTKDKLINTDLITPPLEEQNLIVNYIKKIESTLLKNIDVHKQQIDRLKEYKIILINQAVTGKIKVS